jgi:hypothetical protein
MRSLPACRLVETGGVRAARFDDDGPRGRRSGRAASVVRVVAAPAPLRRFTPTSRPHRSCEPRPVSVGATGDSPCGTTLRASFAQVAGREFDPDQRRATFPAHANARAILDAIRTARFAHFARSPNSIRYAGECVTDRPIGPPLPIIGARF